MFNLTGCDGVLAVEGTVYEWIDPPINATSTIYIDKSIPSGIKIKPLEGATINIWDKSGRGDSNMTSDTTGHFSNFDVVAPGVIKYTIEVKHDQFYTVSNDFLSPTKRDAASTHHNVNILMVRKAS